MSPIPRRGDISASGCSDAIEKMAYFKGKNKFVF
jgi:hypothetical protein